MCVYFIYIKKEFYCHPIPHNVNINTKNEKFCLGQKKEIIIALFNCEDFGISVAIYPTQWKVYKAKKKKKM